MDSYFRPRDNGKRAAVSTTPTAVTTALVAERRFLSPDTLPRPFGYSHVVDVPAGRIVHVSGQVPLGPTGELIGAGDFAAQVRRVFANLNEALDAAGVGWDDVVKLNFFVTDLTEIAALREIRDEYVNTEQPPASTLVQVAALFRPDVMFEADAVAITG
jgi:enamine deaminase RidA (YjgF/YER057c/UK114 family)